MAEILAIFRTALEVVTNKYVFTPITNQFSYLCCFNGNVQALRDQVEKLNKRKSDLELEVDEAKRNTRVIRSSVEEWIEEVGKISEKKERIIQHTAQVQQVCFYGLCPNIKLRYRLSREAKKTAEAAQGLLQEVNKLGNISCPASHDPIPTASAGIQIDSRKSKENEIMDALKDDNIYLIALCGMGGVGKTTMARKIESKVREGKLFAEVVMTVVSRPLDLKNVQQGLAERLGLHLTEQTEPARAERLHTRLKDTESVLIILDDVWAKFHLQEIGIPSKTTHQRCKIILTSRIQRVCTNIEDSAKIIQLDALPEHEGWNLFKEKAGEIVDEPELHQIAKDVASKCKGLPLALVTVAAALRGSSVPSWKDALHQLRASLATDIPEFLEEVYVPLKWSYDQLQNEEARYLFLLCCLFPEDYEIPLHVLVEYGFSLGIFSNTVNLERARNRVDRLVEMIIDRFLLIRVDIIDNDDFLIGHFMRYRVKMHDVIRDMAIIIASKDKHAFMVMHHITEWPKKDCYENYTCISVGSSTSISLPEDVYCPRLELLRVESSYSKVEIQESSFNGMRGLKVLDAISIKKLPPYFSWPKTLRSLFLVNFQLKILPNVIFGLVNLEILCLRSSLITLLPIELGRLKNLRLLDLTYCWALQIIPRGVISGLVQLEELYMNAFDGWEGVKDSNTSVAEIASLKNLTSLQLQADVRDVRGIGKFNWFKLSRYYVVIGKGTEYDCRNLDRCIQLSLFELHPSTNLLQVLFDNAQAIKLEGSGSTMIANKLSRHGYKNVEMLVLIAQELEFLFDSNSWNLRNTGFFPRLTTLVLKRNYALKGICHGQPPTGSFSNLTSLTVEFCTGLKKLFSLSLVAMLSKLELLEIKHCGSIEVVFFEQNGQDGRNEIITFPKLSKISLNSLPSLFALFEASDQVSIQFPQLYKMEIESCPMLKRFCTTKSSSLLERDHNAEQPFFFDEKVTCNKLMILDLDGVGVIELFNHKISIGDFSGLQTVEISWCVRLRSIFSPGMFRGLVNLQLLKVRYCSELEEVISKDEKVGETNAAKETILPRLKELKLCGLPKLIRFCHIKNDLAIPSLERIEIRFCHLLETFSLGSVHLPSSVSIKAGDLGSVEGDLSKETFGSQFLNNKQVMNNEGTSTIS